MDNTTWNEICEDRFEEIVDHLTSLDFELEAYRNLLSIQNDRIVSLERTVSNLKVQAMMEMLFDGDDDEIENIILSLGDN